MKSYTSLEQSRKLAEILPLESADMYYFTIIHDYPYSQGKIRTIVKIMDGSFSSDYDTPCWSLAALFDVLPEINGVNLKFERVKAEDGYNGYYYHIEYEDKILIPYCKNPIDACVEMILKLNEHKLL